MKKIIIFAGGEGRATERVVTLFNEGNRIQTLIVFSNINSDSFTKKIEAAGTRVIPFSDHDWPQREEETLKIIRQESPDLIVFDSRPGFPGRGVLEEEFGDILDVESAHDAPLSIVKALESSVSEMMRQGPPPVPAEEEGPKTAEEEWAESLQIKFEPPKIKNTPPPVPEQEINTDMGSPEPYNPTEPYGRETGFPEPPGRNMGPGGSGQYRSNNGYDNSSYNRYKEEPMPPTYLIWSVLTTIFCCFIPGIVAIIFSSQVSTKFYSGDIEGARRASRMAEIWIIVSFVLGVMSATLWIPWMLIS